MRASSSGFGASLVVSNELAVGKFHPRNGPAHATEILAVVWLASVLDCLRMKKIRFGDLVRNSGRPKTLTLWTEPESNKELQRAIRGNRVLTVHHTNAGKKRDVGEIGFKKESPAIYLIFPRALPARSNEPVIGINYDLLEEPEPQAS